MTTELRQSSPTAHIKYFKEDLQLLNQACERDPNLTASLVKYLTSELVAQNEELPAFDPSSFEACLADLDTTDSFTVIRHKASGRYAGTAYPGDVQWREVKPQLFLVEQFVPIDWPEQTPDRAKFLLDLHALRAKNYYNQHDICIGLPLEDVDRWVYAHWELVSVHEPFPEEESTKFSGVWGYLVTLRHAETGYRIARGYDCDMTDPDEVEITGFSDWIEVN